MRFFYVIFFLISVLKIYANDQMTVLAQSDEYVWFPAIAIDGSGNALALWRDEKLKGIYSSRYDACKQKWDPIIRLSSDEEISQKDFAPSIQMDSHGNAIAIWVGDQAYGTYYDVFTNQWSKPLALTVCEKCQCPAIAVDTKGNAIAIWSNLISNTIQSARFDKISKKWFPTIDISDSTFSHSFCDPLKLEDRVPASPKICIDKLGNTIAVWAEHRINDKYILRAAYCDYKTNIWNTPFIVTFAKCKKISGPDICINSNDNPLITWGESDYQSIYASEYDIKTHKWIFERKFIGLGMYPHILTNQSGNSLLTSILFSEVTKCVVNLMLSGIDNNNETYFGSTNCRGISAFIGPGAYDVGIDTAGNVTAAFNIIYMDQSIQHVYRYHINSQNPEFISLNKYPTGSEGCRMNAVSVHPSGHAAVLWEGFDDSTKKHTICAWVHHAN